MDAHRLVFDVGDLVTGWGTVHVIEGEVWLDLARVVSLIWRDIRGDRSVRLVGADLAAVPTTFGPGVAAGGIAVTGIWLGDSMEVRTQWPGPPLAVRPEQPSGSARGTQSNLDEAWTYLRSRPPGVRFEAAGQRIDGDGVPYLEVLLFRVTPELADWAAPLPPGLLRLDPALAPISATTAGC